MHSDVHVEVSRTAVVGGRSMFQEYTAAVRFVVALPPGAARDKSDHQLICDALVELMSEIIQRDAN